MATIKKIATAACNIIFSNEGNYGSVNKDDNGAVSIGKVQWHGDRALSLLKNIISNAGTLIATTALKNGLYNEITSTSDWNTRTVNVDEAKKISILLLSLAGKNTQDELAEADITTYVNRGISYGLTNAGALIYFCDGVNQYGTYSTLWKSISLAALKNGGDIDAMYSATISQTSNYLTRRMAVYNAVKILSLANENITSEDETNSDEIMEDKYMANDNEPAEWAREAVDFAVANGILFGDNNGDYKLSKTCTRQELIVFLYRVYKLIMANKVELI